MALRLAVIPQTLQEFLAEFFGTLILLFIGFSGVIATLVYSPTAVNKYNDCRKGELYCEEGKGRLKGEESLLIELSNLNILVITLTWGSGLVGAIMLTGHITGGHFNPSMTLTLATMSKISWRKLLHYIPAQYLGAFCSAGLTHLLYNQQMTSNEGTAGNFTHNEMIKKTFVTQSHDNITTTTAILDGFLSCFVFMLMMSAIGDHYGNGVPASAQPIHIIVCFSGVLLTFYLNCGVSINPARDLGPKLYAALWLGVKPVFDDLNYNFWWLSQHLAITFGFITGGWTYRIFFEQIAPQITK